jgi:hypothetical protein
MMMWPSVTALGFVVLTGMVIALGTRSTARYEFERNRARRSAQEQPSGVSAAVGRHPAGGSSTVVSGPADTRAPRPSGVDGQPEERSGQTGVAVLADLPADRPDATGTAGWWLVRGCDDDPLDDGTLRVVSGPYVDRTAADWAALAGDAPAAAGARVVHGVLRSSGRLALRPSPEEQEWLAALGRQVDRLSGDWDELVSDTDPLTTLVLEVTAALLDAGLELHDCDAVNPAGGVCLTPEPGLGGVLVSWRQHDRMSVHRARGAVADTAVQRTMNAALADVLTSLGFAVGPFRTTGCHLVTAAGR